MIDKDSAERAIERKMLFAFEEKGKDHFRTQPIPTTMLRLYGGQVVSQALAAAHRTVAEGKLANSCHAYFVRAGAIDRPLDFLVERDSDGRSFSARRVSVLQDGQLILSLSALFHAHEEAKRHQRPMPDVAPPDGLASMDELIADVGDALPKRHHPFWRRDHIFDWRPVGPFRIMDGQVESPRRNFWLRLKDPAEPSERLHQWFFAYASDLHLLHAGLAPFGLGFADDHLQTASLDHAIWFHEPFRTDEWLLYSIDSPAAAQSLALGTGDLFTADGRLVASTAQQGLIRLHDEARKETL